MLKHSTARPTARERAWLDRIVKYGCLCCIAAGYQCVEEVVERHHIIVGRRRLGHFFTLPLCRGHHRLVWTPRQMSLLAPEYRVAISSGLKAFARVFGSERDLWEILRDHIGLATEWPTSKILPRRTA